MMRSTLSTMFLRDLAKHVKYYDGEREGLGDEFALEVFRRVDDAINHPRRYRATNRPGIRRVLVRRFPYAVFYRMQGQHIIFTRCRADKQRPVY